MITSSIVRNILITSMLAGALCAVVFTQMNRPETLNTMKTSSEPATEKVTPDLVSHTEENTAVESDGDRRERLINACLAKEADSCMMLAAEYVFEELPSLARIYMKKACNLGNKDGCIALAVAATKGYGGERSLEDALLAYERGCDLQSADGCHRLGHVYLMDEFGINDPHLALEAFERACSLENSEACEDLEMYRPEFADQDKTRNSDPI